MNKSEFKELLKGDFIKTKENGEVGAAIIIQSSFDGYVGAHKLEKGENDKILIDRRFETLFEPEEVIAEITTEDVKEMFEG